jgi:DNA-binding NarL/FixJ family response regulator
MTVSGVTSSQSRHISICWSTIIRQGYRRVLDHQSDFRVVAEADSATSAYSAFKAHAPDVIVMDISMKGASGLEAIRNIRARDSHAHILVFSMHSEAALVKPAFNAGASGYVTKSTEPAALIRAIRAVAHGERAMSYDIAHSLAAESLSPSQSALDRLGEREIEILRQLASGATAEQIAANLNLSLKTVQNYHYLVKAKTGLRTDAQLVHLAVGFGLTEL